MTRRNITDPVETMFWAFIVVVVIATCAYAIVAIVDDGGHGHDDTAASFRRVCAAHNGVSRIEDSGLVICRDGWVGERR